MCKCLQIASSVGIVWKRLIQLKQKINGHHSSLFLHIMLYYVVGNREKFDLSATAVEQIEPGRTQRARTVSVTMNTLYMNHFELENVFTSRLLFPCVNFSSFTSTMLNVFQI